MEGVVRALRYSRSASKASTYPQPAKNYTWAQLMARTFEFDGLQCPRCGGRMKIIAAIESPEVVRRILDCLGIVSRPPPLLPARRQIVQIVGRGSEYSPCLT